jgi:integrase
LHDVHLRITEPRRGCVLLSKGHSLRAVSQRLGHANPTMTLRVYAHCLPTDDAKLADGLNARMA